MADGDRLEGRNGRIWRDYCRGASQEKLADRYGLSQAQVSRVIRDVRAAIPETDLDESRQRMLEVLDHFHERVAGYADLGPAPAYSNGRPILDADGKQVDDYSGVLAATATMLKLQERASKMLGLDAPEKKTITLTAEAQAAAAAAAAEAAVWMDETTDGQ